MANYYIFTAGTVPVNFSITAQVLDGTTETATLNGNVIEPSNINVVSIRVFTSMYNNQPAGQDVTDNPPSGQLLYGFAYDDNDDLITEDLVWDNTYASEMVESTDAAEWKIIPFRKGEEAYDRAVTTHGGPETPGNLFPSPGGAGEQYFNWMFRSVHNEDVVYGVHDCAVPWKTEDNGETWVKMKSKYMYGQQEQTMLEHPVYENLLFVAMSDYSGNKDYGNRPRGLLKSTDRGESYEMILREKRVNPNDSNIVGNRSNEDTLVVDPNPLGPKDEDGNDIYAMYWALDGDGEGDRPFYRSIDGFGDVWTKGNNDLSPHLEYQWVPPTGHPKAGQTLDRHYVYANQLCVGANHRVFIAADTGLWYSDNAHSAADDEVTWISCAEASKGTPENPTDLTNAPAPWSNPGRYPTDWVSSDPPEDREPLSSLEGGPTDLPNWFTSVQVDPSTGDVYAISLDCDYSDTHANYGGGGVWRSTENGDPGTWKRFIDPTSFKDMTGPNWQKYSATKVFQPYSIFFHPSEDNGSAGSAWIISGPDQSGRIRNFYFWPAELATAAVDSSGLAKFGEAPEDTNTPSRYMYNADYDGAENSTWKRYITGSRTQVAFHPTENTAIVQGMASIFKNTVGNGPTTFYYAEEWFKGENWTGMAFDYYDDEVMYSASEDTSVSQITCNPDSGRTEYWTGVTTETGVVTKWYTSKAVHIQGDYLFCNRGLAIGRRKLLQAPDRLSPLVQWRNPPGGVDYTNLHPDNIALDEKDSLVPHGWDRFYTHPITGCMVSGDNVSASWEGNTWTAIPGLRYEGSLDDDGFWDSSGDSIAISAEVCGIAQDPSADAVYVWAVNGTSAGSPTAAIRNRIYRARWDGTPTGFFNKDGEPGWDKIVRGVTNDDQYSWVDSSYAICANPNDPNMLWARIANGGASWDDGHLFRYDHANETWTQLSFIKDNSELISEAGIKTNIAQPVINTMREFAYNYSPEVLPWNLDGDNSTWTGVAGGTAYDYTNKETQSNAVGSIIYDPNYGTKGLLYVTPHFAAGSVIYRNDNHGDDQTGGSPKWDDISFELPCLSNTKIYLHPVTGELVRGGCDGTYVLPPPSGYMRPSTYRTLWSRAYDIPPTTYA